VSTPTVIVKRTKDFILKLYFIFSVCVVCVSVCWNLDTLMYYIKTAEPIEKLFGG